MDASSSKSSPRAGVAGIVLAAGEGKGFGGPKALVRFSGQTLVERAVQTLLAGGCRPVCVVLGAAAEQVRETSFLDNAVVVVNEQWPDGMGGSLRVGLDAARRERAGAALVLLADQPLVTPDLVERLISAWRAGARAAVAAFRGEGLTPVLLDRTLWQPVARAAVGDLGARALLRAQPELVTLVDCDDVGSPDDIDTPEDLDRLQRGTSR